MLDLKFKIYYLSESQKQQNLDEKSISKTEDIAKFKKKINNFNSSPN